MSDQSTISSRLQFNMIGDEAIAALRQSKSFVMSELPARMAAIKSANAQTATG